MGLLRRIFRPTDSRRYLLRNLPVGSVGCEVGVWKGDFSQRMLDVVKPRRLYLLDPWLFQPEFKGSWYGGTVASSQEDMDAIFLGVVERFKQDQRVEIIRAKTEDLADETIPGDSLDWAYIDGNHQYEFVIKDLETFAGKVKPGGVLCGDDYGRGESRPVTRAVEGFLRGSDFKMEWVEGSQFFLRKGS